MTAAKAHDILDRLVEAANTAVLKPPHVLAMQGDTELLCAEVEHAHALPAEQRLIHDEDVLLARVLVMHCRAQNDTAGARRIQALQQVIGVLLPIARNHAALALMAKHNVPATTYQDYAKRRSA